MKRFTSLLIPAVFLLASLQVRAQQPLDGYIRKGLRENIVLKQKNIALEQGMLALKEARSLFLPTVDFTASYNNGQGGRYFAFPAGDLMNPVYQTLNQLTSSNDFPRVENIDTYLNPYNYYDAHVRTSLPVFNRDLSYNRRIKEQQVTLQEYEIDIYKRELVKDIKTAYFSYLMALSGERIYESALAMVSKNLDINESLLKNGKGLPANVRRAESEVENVKSGLLNARKQVKNARRYFNFLLNKPLDSEINADFQEEPALQKAGLSLEGPSVAQREELKSLETGIRIYQTRLKMDKHFWLPKLSSFIDLGSQATDWEFSSKSRYYFWGLQLDIPLFHGKRNKYKIAQTKLALEEATLNYRNSEQQLELSARTARENLLTAWQELQSAHSRLESAQSYFRLINKGFSEGVNTLIEFLDARNQLTSAEVQVSVDTYKVLQAKAVLERETAGYLLR